MGKVEILSRISRNTEPFLKWTDLCSSVNADKCNLPWLHEAKCIVPLETISTQEELQFKIRPDCCCLKWETPVPRECGPVAFWRWIDSPANGLDSEWQKPLNDAATELPRALCQRNGVQPMTQHVSQTSGLSGTFLKVSSCQHSTCRPPKAWEPNASKAGFSKSYPGQAGKLCRKDNSASL